MCEGGWGARGLLENIRISNDNESFHFHVYFFLPLSSTKRCTGLQYVYMSSTVCVL